MVDRHDDDDEAAQHVDGREAVRTLVGESIHRADIETLRGLRQMTVAMKTTLHGIKNCDTMKKARTWLASHDIEYGFHDYKAEGIDRAMLEGWVRQVGWEMLLNRAGTTFRALPDAKKQNLDAKKAVALMLDQPSMIKRPVLVRGKTLLVGFSPEKFAALT
jgi:arsenate reductase